MKKSNSKAFTIVELVIVIAIIAILAAVLIPTFAAIIKKANLSNDRQNVRNMNTVLVAEVIPDTQFASAGKAIIALYNAGWNEGRLNAYNRDYHYAYSLEKNRMYLIDDQNQIVFPDNEVELSSLWGLYMDDRTSFTPGITKYVAIKNITNSDHYNELFNTSGYVIDLNDHFIAVDATASGNVTASNGIVIKGADQGTGASDAYEVVEAVSSEPATANKTTTTELRALTSDVVYDDSTKTLTVNNKVFTKRVHIYDPNMNVVFNDCVFYGEGIQFDDGTGAHDGIKGTLRNCQFIDIGNKQWAVMLERSLEMDGCTFVNLKTRGALQAYDDSKDMVIDIKNCVFEGVSEEYPVIRFVAKDTEHVSITSVENKKFASFSITGCEFKALNQATAIIGCRDSNAPLYDYTGEAGQPTVTFSNNKISSDIPKDKYVTGVSAGNTLADLLEASAN